MQFATRSMLQKYSICSHHSNRKKNSCKSASILPIQPGSEASEVKKLHFCRNFLIMHKKPGKKLHFCRIPSSQRSITWKPIIYLHSTSIPPYPPYDPALPTLDPYPQRNQLIVPHPFPFRRETNSSPSTRTASAKRQTHCPTPDRIRKETNLSSRSRTTSAKRPTHRPALTLQSPLIRKRHKK